MANELERVRSDISRYEDRCAEVEEELRQPLNKKQRDKREKELILLLANLVELRKEKNLAQEAQERSAAAGQLSAAAFGALNQKLDIVLAQQQVISQQYQAILTSITSSAHLPPSSLDSAARQNLREDVLLKYKAVDGKGWTWCLVTGRFWPPLPDTNAPHVRACHIFQRKWGITEWAGLELGPSLDTPINVIPTHAGVEHAFDGFQVIVLPSQAEEDEDGETIFTVHVLDPELLHKTVYGEFKSRQHENSTPCAEPPSELAAITFMDIDKTPLKFRPDSDMRPAKRCFMAHALWALTFAKVRKWPVDPGIRVTVDSFGWRSPTFMEARERTQLWVHMQAAGVAAGLPAGPIDGLLADELPADELPAGSIDGLPTSAVGSG
ncbi:hypothetical protein CHLRE_10g459100v5 [Chlamydomonas reinhardtii]|uniref:Uncharacterized protein n=1 Tax=Chlamydomonas reinhardtii TaxID=3055 RepID=A0A2K3DBS1_CHLRE|nr:uncharacterized protein CHLRE_10g459100v5 [Chlamydomonas reinhardtii]PNW77972.1 hypothetical protein CHLRE_10g459100v5 [Chlamydomonas reinhardtii]